MAKHKAPKHIREMRKEGKVTMPRKKGLAALKLAIGRFPKAVTSAIGILVTVSGLLSLYAMLVPQVTISATDPLDKSALSAPFNVTNSSLFTIYDIKTLCNVEDLNSQGGPMGYVRFAGISVSPRSEAFTELAIVSVSVNFRPSWAWWKKTKFARFETRFASDGKVRWVPLAKSQSY
jgi:hypothetical protein